MNCCLIPSPSAFSLLTTSALIMNLHNSFHRNLCLLFSSAALSQTMFCKNTQKHMYCMYRDAVDDMQTVEATVVQFGLWIYSKWSRSWWIIEASVLFSLLCLLLTPLSLFTSLFLNFFSVFLFLTHTVIFSYPPPPFILLCLISRKEDQIDLWTSSVVCVHVWFEWCWLIQCCPWGQIWPILQPAITVSEISRALRQSLFTAARHPNSLSSVFILAAPPCSGAANAGTGQ